MNSEEFQQDSSDSVNKIFELTTENSSYKQTPVSEAKKAPNDRKGKRNA